MSEKTIGVIFGELLAALHKRYQSVGLCTISYNGREFLAAGMDHDGHICDPRTWGYHPTPEAAIRDLHRQLTAGPTAAEVNDLAEVMEKAEGLARGN